MTAIKSFLIHLAIFCLLVSSTFLPNISWFFDFIKSNFLLFPGRKDTQLNFLIEAIFQGNFLVASLPLLPFLCRPALDCPDFPKSFQIFWLPPLSHYMAHSGHKMAKNFRNGAMLGLPLFS